MADEYYDFYNPADTDYSTNWSDYYNFPSYEAAPAENYANTSSGLLNTLGSAGSSLLNFLGSSTGKGLLGLGGGVASLLSSPDTRKLSQTTTQPLGQYGQTFLPGMFGQAMSLPTTISPQAQNLFGQMNLSDYMNAFPAEIWNRAEANIPSTQTALEANLAQVLGRVAPRAYSMGTNIQDMIKQVASTDYQTRQLLTNLLTQRAQAEQTATLAQPTQLSSLLGLANYPQTYQQGATTSIANLYNLLATLEKGGQPQMISGQDYTDQDIWSKLAPVLGALAGQKA
jgi:hypothetical protein